MSQKDSGKGDSSSGSTLQAPGESSSASKQCDTSDSAYGTGSASEKESETKGDSIGSALQAEGESSSASKQGDTRSDSAYGTGSASEKGSETNVQNGEVEELQGRVLEACETGALDVIRELVAAKKVELKKCIANNAHKDPPLHFAAYHGHKRIVKYLIDEVGCDVESKNHYQNTPLHRAARQGKLEVVKYLVEKKKSNPMSVCGWRRTPLHNACKNGELEVVKYLMSNTRVERYAKDSLRKQTPLQLAAEHGRVEVVQYMTENGVDREEPGPYTLLHLAAYSGKLDIVQYLIQKRNYNPMIRDKYESTPLHSACVKGQLKVVKYLVEECEVEISNCDNRYQESPLGSAAKNGEMRVIKYLVEEKNCIIEHGVNNQNTALHSAAWGGALDVVKYFIDKKNCSPSCRGRKARTPLHRACYSGKGEVVDYLVDQHNVEVSCRDDDGATPLHLAVKGGHLPLVKQLVRKHKCDHASRDNAGKTPLDYASNANHTTTVEYLSLIKYITTDEDRKQLEEKLKKYEVSCRPTGVELGEGSYSVVIELKLDGHPSVRLAGKVFKTRRSAVKYENKLIKEIGIMVQLTHCNIVAYKGVYFQPDATLPVLVMERLMTSLHSYLLDPVNSNIPVERKISILLDTARGLEYLHSLTPAIIHRDLTPKNVLLDSQLRAKIADFGNSRIMELHYDSSPESMTNVPGTLNYMPPEAAGMSVKYGPSLDVFSFGHLSLFTIIQSPVQPLLPHNYTDSNDELKARSEVQRRGKFLERANKLLLEGHPLLKLIKQCLSNKPAHRPPAAELVERLQAATIQVSSPQYVEATDSSDDSGVHKRTVKEDTNSDSSQIRSQKDSGIGITGEDSSSNAHSTTPNRAAADPTIAGTRDTEGMEDIVAAEQVTGLSTAAENTEGQTSFSVPVSSQRALEDRDTGNDSGVQGAQDTNSDSKQKESQEDSGIGNTGEDSSSNTHSITPSRAPADPTTAGTGDTEGMEDIVAAEQVTTAAEGTEVQTSTSVPVSSPQVVEVTDSGDDSVFPVIRGADIVARITVEITPDQPLDFDWEGHGFRVYIPAGAVSRRVTLCIQASLSGDYQLPDDGVLVSGVYWLSLHPHMKLQKKATITLQHCANDDSPASFITARCTQQPMPYTFRKLPEASFSVPKEGTTQVDHFSGFGTSGSISEYSIRSYYIPKKPNVFDIHITVTPNLALQLKGVRKAYIRKPKGPKTIVCIEEEAISLSLTKDSCVSEVKRDGWELTLLVRPATLQRTILNGYKKGKSIPHFELNLKLRDESSPQYFEQEVHFTGTQHPISIILSGEPQIPEAPPPGTGEPPEITRLTTNLSSITEAVTVTGSLQWFADRLLEKAFIAREAARGIRAMHGVTPADQARKLMESVFTRINGSDNKSRWFHEFVDIFSHDRAYEDLVDRLKLEF